MEKNGLALSHAGPVWHIRTFPGLCFFHCRILVCPWLGVRKYSDPKKYDNLMSAQKMTRALVI
jgi:hypothetical protein